MTSAGDPAVLSFGPPSINRRVALLLDRGGDIGICRERLLQGEDAVIVSARQSDVARRRVMLCHGAPKRQGLGAVESRGKQNPGCARDCQ